MISNSKTVLNIIEKTERFARQHGLEKVHTETPSQRTLGFYVYILYQWGAIKLIHSEADSGTVVYTLTVFGRVLIQQWN